MAKPQLENGYTMIANELLEAVALYLSNSDWLKMTTYLFRLTYGFHRKKMETAYNTLALRIGKPEDHARRIVEDMQKANIIGYNPINGKRLEIWINKDYESWRVR